MRKLLAVFLFITLTLPPVDAEPPRVFRAPATPAPATPATDGTGAPKRSLLERLMNPGPTPAPAPAPTPTPFAKRPRKSKTPGEGETQKPVPAVMAAPTATAKSSAGKGTAKSAPKDKSDLSGMDDSTKFKIVKAKAMEDSQVKELKAKADSEVDETDARKALDAYNRALFRKVREIEPSLDGYVDRIESSMARRLTAEKGKL